MVLNRELATAQQQQSQLLDILADPQRSQAFMAEYQRQLGATGYSSNAGRADFPGGSPGPTLYIPTSPNDIGYWWDQFQDIVSQGNPPVPQIQARINQRWNEFPEQALLNLVQHFPEF